MISRRQFLAATPTTLTALAAAPHLIAADEKGKAAPGEPTPPRIGSSSRPAGPAGAKTAQLTITSSKVCRILQFTDLHFFYKTDAEDKRTIEDFRKHLDLQQPDLVVVSGDLWHDNPDGRGWRGQELALKAFSEWGVPWTTIWGNHDLLDDYQRGHDAFEQAGGSLYRGGGTHGDYRVEVRAAGGGTDAAVALDLFFLNSSDEGLTAWQVRALGQMLREVAGQRPKPAPAFAFFHMPILEYETRIKPETFKGVKLEGVGHGKENGQALPVIGEARTIRACFCGHNHTNDYVVKAGAVDLVFGRATGYAGYGGEKLRKGAKLIEIDLASGNYQQTTVFADGSKYVL